MQSVTFLAANSVPLLEGSVLEWRERSPGNQILDAKPHWAAMTPWTGRTGRLISLNFSSLFCETLAITLLNASPRVVLSAL